MIITVGKSAARAVLPVAQCHKLMWTLSETARTSINGTAYVRTTPLHQRWLCDALSPQCGRGAPPCSRREETPQSAHRPSASMQTPCRRPYKLFSPLPKGLPPSLSLCAGSVPVRVFAWKIRGLVVNPATYVSPCGALCCFAVAFRADWAMDTAQLAESAASTAVPQPFSDSDDDSDDDSVESGEHTHVLAARTAHDPQATAVSPRTAVSSVSAVSPSSRPITVANLLKECRTPPTVSRPLVAITSCSQVCHLDSFRRLCRSVLRTVAAVAAHFSPATGRIISSASAGMGATAHWITRHSGAWCLTESCFADRGAEETAG